MAPTGSQRKSRDGTSEGDREEMLDIHTLRKRRHGAEAL